MKKGYGVKILVVGVLSLSLAVSGLCTGFVSAETSEEEKDISIIFTHDMHSHMDADKAEKDGKIVEVGGFAKLKTAMARVKSDYPGSFVLDAGDFAMGTPYQTIFSQEASEMKMLKFMGYDATTLGNHEFDYRATGLAKMLNSSADQGVTLLCANIDWKKTLADSDLKEDAQVLKNACESYGVKDYTVVDRDGISIAVFGIIGLEAIDFAPESGLLFKDPVETAGKVVKEIKKNEDVDAIVCLSHSGTVEEEGDAMEESEDYILAEKVPDIDVIISGHSHTVLEGEVKVGDTTIVSCGSYNANMGHVVITKRDDKYKAKEYEVIELDEFLDKNQAVEAELDKYRKYVDEDYFNNYGYQANQSIANNSIDFTSITEFSLQQGEDTLGDLLSDSYKYAVAQAEDGAIKGYEDGGVAWGEVISDKGGAQVTVVPSGVVRSSFFKGDVTVSDAFNTLSLGYGKDGKPGYPLVRVYLTGKELKAIAEVDASVSNFMGTARLYSSGLGYSWNPNRLILNRAVDIKYNDGESIEKVKNDKLYSVIADLYSCQMLGSVKAKSLGLLAIDPKDAEGNPIRDYEANIIYDDNGNEVKAWYAAASYIDSFENDEIPDYYSETHNRKLEIDSLNPVEMLKQPNKVAAIAVVAVLALILIVIGIVMLVRMIRRRRKATS
ncbi:MAG: bifunctional metallophosphatase/5'-nucleotidase [Clostridiales bacterium]|nr:bifunctional metallophosphatase/5'-nucleotidase [Clostridiales bacterium]